MKRILIILLSIICWFGAILAEVFCGFSIALLFFSTKEFTLAELAVTLTYLGILFVFGPIMYVAAFRFFYRQYHPSHRIAKSLIALSIITFALILPTCYFLILSIFELSGTFLLVLSLILAFTIPISSITTCIYVLKCSLQQLNEQKKRL